MEKRKSFAAKLKKVYIWLLNLFPYKFQSFAPDEKLKDRTSKKYLKQLRHLMKNKRVTNIAVTGDLGVGKSTLIRNYERKHKPFRYPWQKFFYLSVKDLQIEELENGVSDEMRQKLQQELEVRLLKQLLVVCEKKDIAGCHYQPVPERKSPVIPFIFTAAAVLLAAWGLGFLDNLAYWEYDLWLMILVLVLAAIVVWFAARQLHIHYKTPSFSFRFGSEQNGGSADAAPDTDAELLDKYLMDIVYVMETVYEKSGGVLVIEDLDRYGSEVCVPILEKFREINILINQRLRSKMKKPFRFLYVLRDDIFAELSEDEPSTVPPSKFFDGLLTIVPQLGYANSVDFLTEKWMRYEFDPKFLLAISRYVYDYRQIRAIENEYHIFRSVADENCKGLNIPNTAIMAFCVYRHFYPAEYYQIRKDTEHELVKYLVEQELHRIQKDINRQNVFTLKEPKLPEDKRMAMLFGFMKFNVLACMFPGNVTVELLEIFAGLDEFVRPKVEYNSFFDYCQQTNISYHSYESIMQMLEQNLLQTDQFRLIFAIYLAYCIIYTNDSDEREQILKIQKELLKLCEDKPRFAFCNAITLVNSIAKTQNTKQCIEIVNYIRDELLKNYPITEIAQRYAMALSNATARMNNASEIREIANRIRDELFIKYPTAEIALEYAAALANLTDEMTDSKEIIGTAEFIKNKLLVRYQTAEIAEMCAMAFANATAKMGKVSEIRKTADRIRDELFVKYPTQEIALNIAISLVNMTVKMNGSKEILRIANRIRGELFNKYPVLLIALEYARALANATTRMKSLSKIKETAELINKEVLANYPTAEIAGQYAIALANMTDVMTNLKDVIETAEFIKSKLLSKYQTAEIAEVCAMAFANATEKIIDANGCISIARCIKNELFDKYQTAESAANYAMALSNATMKMHTADEILNTADRYRADLLSDPALWSEDLNKYYGWIIENAEEKIPTDSTHRAPLEARLNEHKEYLEQLKAAHSSP